MHVVRRGDNLWTIARRYRLSARSLAEWNRIDGERAPAAWPDVTLAPARAPTAEPPAASDDAGGDLDGI